jgi:hypothetical protein
MSKIKILNTVYQKFTQLKRKHINNENLDDILNELGDEIHKSDESLNNRLEFNKTEIDRLSGL